MIIGLTIGMGLVVFGAPLYMRWVPQNPIYGLRTSATCDDEWIWYEANAASGLEMMVAGAAISALAAGLGLAGISGKDATRVVAIGLVGVACGLLFSGVRRANRLQRSRNSESVDDSSRRENI